MKINYQIEMEKEISRIKAANLRPRLLLHSCCAPCSSHVLELLDDVFEITVFYYNPNIAPYEEFERRVEEQIRLIDQMPLKHHISVIRGDFDDKAFYDMCKGHEMDPEGGERCTRCFRMRLGKTAQMAAKGGFDYFTTTLSISPLKDARRLNAIGGEFAGLFGVPYLFSDFKKKNGYKRSCELSAQYELYRQDYCGCIFSKQERERQKLNIPGNAVLPAVSQSGKNEGRIAGAGDRDRHPEKEAECLNPEGILCRVNTRQFAREMEIHECIDSTNTRAKLLAEQGAGHGFLVGAASQTGGRGRMGRQFFSPKDSGIYISFVLRPELPADRAVMITPMAAVAVARAIEALAGVDVRIKWVNDLYINGRKVCGILSEASMDFESGRLEYAVLGIGVNVGRIDFPQEIQNIATSIFNETGVSVSVNELTAGIANQLELLYDGLETASFMDEYRSRSNVIGCQVTVLRGSEHFEAEVLDIDDQARLVVRTEKGIEYVGSGEISIRVKGVHY